MVRIEGCVAGQEIILRVTDDGIGMSEEQLMRIFEKKESAVRKNGVGVQNVHERLQLYYGKNYGLTFFSTQGQGTAVEIHIPFAEGGAYVSETI